MIDNQTIDSQTVDHHIVNAQTVKGLTANKQCVSKLIYGDGDKQHVEEFTVTDGKHIVVNLSSCVTAPVTAPVTNDIVMVD